MRKAVLRYTMRKHTGFAHTLVLERMTTKIPTSLANTHTPLCMHKTKQNQTKSLSHTGSLTHTHSQVGIFKNSFFSILRKSKLLFAQKMTFVIPGWLQGFLLDMC